jgi:Rrf2 family nitric oxide-sensitive transcriptional repressor
VECFSNDKNNCLLTSHCKLAKILDEALESFLAVLDEYTLADISTPKVKKLLHLN